MSEDLDSFFAKRKTKASKKKGAIKIDDVAQSLEYNLKLGQEEGDGSGKRDNDSTFKHEEDSEWIGYENKASATTESVGVFSYNEQVEQEYIAEERKQQAEKAKIWQKTAEPEPVKEETPPVQSPAPVPEPQQKVTASAYVPPGARSNYQAPVKRPVHKVDIGNEELFPSLGDTFVKEEKPQKPKQPEPVQEKTPEPAKSKSPEPIPQDPVQQVDHKPVVEQRPTPEQRPRASHFGSQEDRPRPAPPAPRADGLRGTGMFNARGEEIMINDRPSAPPPKQELTWRQAAGNTVTETRPIPTQSPPAEHHQRPHHPPAPEKPEVTNWRSDPKPAGAPAPQHQRFDQRRHHDRPPRDHHDRPPRDFQDRPPRDHHDRPPRDFQNRPPRDHHDRRDRPAEPKPEPQSWRRDEPPAASEPNPPQPTTGEVGDDDWHTVSGSKSKGSKKSGPAKTAYVPPFRR